jgi:hypothetical protein
MDRLVENQMSPGRTRLAIAILAIIVIGQSADILLQREDWPFSNYPMYARLIRKKETSLLRLYGRRASDGEVIPIVDDKLEMYVPPVNELRMKNILDYAWNHGGEPATRQILHDYLVMYEQQRRRLLGQQGSIAPGPRLSAAICMRVTWQLDARDGTVGPPKLEELASASASHAHSTTRPLVASEAAQ